MRPARPVFFWVLIILFVNGVLSFVSAASNPATDQAELWGLFATTAVYCIGLTQAGIVFTAIMRIAKSQWGRYFNRMGEMLTLSYLPATVILLIIIYYGGVDHIFYWAGPEAGAHSTGHSSALSPWLTKRFFAIRYIVLTPLFYITSFHFFRTGRIEERMGTTTDAMQRRLTVLAALVCFFYVWLNTNIAWDFGMMIKHHWESTIFPGYFWVGNLFASFAFLYLVGVYFISSHKGIRPTKNHLASMGILLMGFELLWVYMYYSQHVVIWYGDLPERAGPLFKQMEGNYLPTYIMMILATFVVPFILLLFRKIKTSVLGLGAAAIIICVGLWYERYLMVMPVFGDGSAPVFFTWTGLALLSGGISSILLSLMTVLKFTPWIPVTRAPFDRGIEYDPVTRSRSVRNEKLSRELAALRTGPAEKGAD